MISRKESVRLIGIPRSVRVLQISDVHFSVHNSHEKRQKITSEILRITDFCAQPSLHVIAVTGDLISRSADPVIFSDALGLLGKLRRIAPVIYSLGNHETDLPAQLLAQFLRDCRKAGILVLDNISVLLQDILFTGLTLPGEVYKNQGNQNNQKIQNCYTDLMPITKDLVSTCVGNCVTHPCVLLAHSPLGFRAYADWGADMILSGHVHGGIVRLPGVGGILSPERRFFPAYTKGLYEIRVQDSQNSRVSRMSVSAGIGKFRMNNPAELVCLDFVP
ncbi:MAG: metallophosphoesterase [Oscillospiraceae bacterium]|nr:metallophosphoesterase [Oscillospiraceae bacterium]